MKLSLRTGTKKPRLWGKNGPRMYFLNLICKRGRTETDLLLRMQRIRDSPQPKCALGNVILQVQRPSSSLRPVSAWQVSMGYENRIPLMPSSRQPASFLTDEGANYEFAWVELNRCETSLDFLGLSMLTVPSDLGTFLTTPRAKSMVCAV